MPERRMCNASSVMNYRGDCNRTVPIDAPVSLCFTHLRRVYEYVGQSLAEAPLAFAGGRLVENLFGREVARVGDYPPPPVEHGPPAPVVYYIRNQQRIKIGWTSNLRRRVHGLTYDEILAVEPGGVELEKMRHQQFAADRFGRRGEWFQISDSLTSHIEMIRSHYSDQQSLIELVAKRV